MGVHLLHLDIGRPRRRPASESDGQLQLRRGLGVDHADVALDRILKMALRSGVSPGYNNENIPWINVRHSILRVPNPRAAGSSRKLTSVCSRSEPSVIVTPK